MNYQNKMMQTDNNTEKFIKCVSCGETIKQIPTEFKESCYEYIGRCDKCKTNYVAYKAN